MSGKLNERLRGLSRVCLDTNVFIYVLQDSEPYASLLRPLFNRLSLGSLSAVTSFITLLEILVKPLKDGDKATAQKYARVLTTTRNLTLLPVERAVAEVSAEIRARHGSVKNPDAIQLRGHTGGGRGLRDQRPPAPATRGNRDPRSRGLLGRQIEREEPVCGPGSSHIRRESVLLATLMSPPLGPPTSRPSSSPLPSRPRRPALWRSTAG